MIQNDESMNVIVVSVISYLLMPYIFPQVKRNINGLFNDLPVKPRPVRY